MTIFHVGAVGFDRPRARYARRLKFVEVELRAPLPAPKKIASWRTEVGEGFTYAITAPMSLFGDRDFPLRDAAVTRSEVDRLVNTLGGVKPEILVVRTPNAVRPNTVALERFFALCSDRLLRVAGTLVWKPTGLWERPDALEAATKAVPRMLVAADPLHHPVDGEKRVYARLEGRGTDARYHDGKLEELLEALSGAEEAWIAFDTATAYKEAVRFTAIASGTLVPAFSSGDEEDEGDEVSALFSSGGDDDEEDEEEDDDLDDDEDEDDDGDEEDDEDEEDEEDEEG